MKLLLLPFFMLSLCLGVCGTVIAAKDIGGWNAAESLLWGLSVLLGIIIPNAVLIQEHDKQLAMRREIEKRWKQELEKSTH